MSNQAFSSSEIQAHNQEKAFTGASHLIATKTGAVQTITSEEIEKANHIETQRKIQRRLRQELVITGNEQQTACCTIQ
ncbi:MAG: hypothetical protein K0U24_00905 [Gammaproteobacteria bacterium]|nr:hypothetical protein [Gammaproteobacteria bacterium]